MARHDQVSPMTLANMRENGVRSLMVYCSACPRTVSPSALALASSTLFC